MSVNTARILRKKMTEAETRLWFLLRDRRLQNYKFYRQFPVGPYVLDFACQKKFLAVELDGGQHCENEKDEERTRIIESFGWRVLRFWNNDMLQRTESVLEMILHALE